MKEIHLKRLKKEHPLQFVPSIAESAFMWFFAIAMVLVAGGLVFRLSKIFAMSVPGTPMSWVPLVLLGVIALIWLRLFQSKPIYPPKPGWTFDACQCQLVYDEILQNQLAVKNDDEYANLSAYSLKELVEIYFAVSRDEFPERFKTVAYLIKERLE
ncbi:MAG: hypothetical protein JXX29_13250 [Deltaproteobacteria bacterium]|nr:hypothetical protein [Deltaproteobacteria bacterium]MBN2672645.1 hypothetical protein [Deltaproteobacteria bacterium]